MEKGEWRRGWAWNQSQERCNKQKQPYFSVLAVVDRRVWSIVSNPDLYKDLVIFSAFNGASTGLLPRDDLESLKKKEKKKKLIEQEHK